MTLSVWQPPVQPDSSIAVVTQIINQGEKPDILPVQVTIHNHNLLKTELEDFYIQLSRLRDENSKIIIGTFCANHYDNIDMLIAPIKECFPDDFKDYVPKGSYTPIYA